jgi:hypothetical protein
MSESLTVAHTPSSCRWSRLGYRLSRIAEFDQPESLWVCVQSPNTRRSLSDEECTDCDCWEPLDGRGIRVVAEYPVPRWRMQCE